MKYRHVEILSSEGPPEPAEIGKVEALLGAKLPTDFLDFLQVANGGFHEYCVRVPPENEVISFGDIYLAGPDSRGEYGIGTLVGEIGAAKSWAQTPDAVLPFARDGAGSEVLLDLTQDGKGKVVAYIHGLPEWAAPIQEDRFIELAPSFAEYIDMHFKCEGLL